MAIISNLKALIFAVLLASGFVLSSFMQGYQDIHYAPVLALLSLALVFSLSRPSLALPISGAALCILLLWALYAIAFAFSTIPFISQVSFLIFCAFPLAFLGVSFWGEDQPRLITPLASLSALAFGALAICAIYHALFIPDGLYASRAHWPFINPNSLATVLTIGLIPFAGLALGCAERKRKIILSLITLLLYAGLIATASRGGLLAATIGGAVLLGLNRARWTPRGLAPVALGGVAIFVLLPFLAGNHLWRSLGNLAGPPTASVIDRLSLWKSSWAMMLDHPWIGTGPGTFSAYYPAYREMLRDQSAGNFSHFDPLQMGTEMGIVGPILCYALLIAVLIRTIRAMRVLPAAHPLRLWIITPFAALLAVAVHAHICFPLYMMPILLLCGVLLAFWHQATCMALSDDGLIHWTPANLLQKMGVIAGGVALGCVVLILAGSSALGSFYMQKALHQTNTQDYLTALAKAERFAPKSFIDPEIEMARINLRLLAGKEIQSPRLQEQWLQETETLLNAAESWNPQWAEIDYLRGKLLTARGEKNAGAAAWESGLRKNPMHFTTRRALAEYFQDSNNPDAAIAVISQGLNYPHPLTYRQWAQQSLQDLLQKGRP